MDLVYTDSNRTDLGVLQNYKLDLAYGSDENDFELTVSRENHVCSEGTIIYIEGTEYGGIVDAIRVDTASDKIAYKGSTWHGLLESKVIEPDMGEDYLIVSGDANRILQELIERFSLSGLFKVNSKASNLIIKSYQMNRYVKGYTGIKKMLASVNGKLKFVFEGGFITIWAEPLMDYSADDEFDSDQIDFIIEKKFIPINHMICLGKGELKDRTVIHIYSDKNGNISQKQVLFGIEERTDVYENPNAESEDDLYKGGLETLKQSRNKGELQFNFNVTDEKSIYDIGDVIGAKELVTGITMARAIAKKIVVVTNDLVKISYKVGE